MNSVFLGQVKGASSKQIVATEGAGTKETVVADMSMSMEKMLRQINPGYALIFVGANDIYAYSGREEVEEEIRNAQKYYITKGFSMINVSNKPIETSAEEISEMITRRFKMDAHIRD